MSRGLVSQKPLRTSTLVARSMGRNNLQAFEYYNTYRRRFARSGWKFTDIVKRRGSWKGGRVVRRRNSTICPNHYEKLDAAHKTIGDAYYKTRWGDAAYE